MKAILLAALAVTVALILLRDPPRETPAPKSAAAPKPAPPAAPKAPPAAQKPAPVAKAAPARKTPPAPKSEPKIAAAPAPLAQEPAPAPTPIAAVAIPDPLPPATLTQPAPQPDSVFGWGHWSGGPAGGSSGASVPGDDLARAQGLAQPVNFALPSGSDAPASSPGIPVAAGITPSPVSQPPSHHGGWKPGHGWGDRNHWHKHKRDR